MTGLGDLECGESLLGDGRGGATIRNLGFEAGAYGRAASWESGSETQSGTFASFGPGAAESFEGGWSNRPYAFALPTTTAARFSAGIYVTPPAFEDFERGWANFPFFTSTFAGITCLFTGSLDAEAFEAGWGNDAYLYAFAGGLTAAVFTSGNPFEAFEVGWGNDAYLFTFGGGDTTAMVISGVRAVSVEDFEHVQVAQLYTANAGSDSIATVGHGLSVNYRVIFDGPIAGAMPTPIAPTVPYYVQGIDGDTFTIALVASAGAPIDLTTAGSGLLRWSAPYENWTSRMATI